MGKRVGQYGVSLGSGEKLGPVKSEHQPRKILRRIALF